MAQAKQRFASAALDWPQISRGMVVRFRDGGIGTVEHLWDLAHHTGSIHMVVRLATPPPHEIVVPLERVHAVGELGVDVDVDSVPIELLPAHSTV
jgi:hypothetical protein